MIGDTESIESVKDIGSAIREKRRAMGYRQIDLARAAGTGCRFISELENGKVTIEIGKVLKVLEALSLKLKCFASTRLPETSMMSEANVAVECKSE